MSDLKDFLRRRRDLLEARLEQQRLQSAEIQKEIIKIEAELRQIRTVERTIGKVNGLEREPHVQRRQVAKLTIKDAVLATLRDYPAGLTALQILAEINTRFEMNVVRTSLSPQLSRLKRDGKLAAN